MVGGPCFREEWMGARTSTVVGRTIYNKGFGDLNDEFWLGLNKIYRLTRNSDINTTLRVDLEGFDGVKLFAKYDQFKVLDYSNQYQLVVAGYSGDAGDSLLYHSHHNFSIKDHLGVHQCATAYKGAWWYDHCHVSNLSLVHTAHMLMEYSG